MYLKSKHTESCPVSHVIVWRGLSFADGRNHKGNTVINIKMSQLASPPQKMKLLLKGLSLISGFWLHIDECSCLFFNHRLPEPVWENFVCTQESCASDSGLFFFVQQRKLYTFILRLSCQWNLVCEWRDSDCFELHLLIYTIAKTGLSSYCMRADL